jgi:hypothetical protein
MIPARDELAIHHCVVREQSADVIGAPSPAGLKQQPA